MVNELIQPGVNGALYQGAPVGLGQAMAQLLADATQLERWGEASRTQLGNDFRQEHCVELLEELLERLSKRF
jgi:glycosyltransferase involved in cell wall biosynthesis